MVTDINKILNQLGIEAITLDEIEESEEESADEIEEESADEIEEESADEIEEESAEDSSTYTSADDDTTSSMVSADDATDVSASTNASAAEERSSGITKQGYKNLKNQIFDYQQKSHTTDEDISFYKGIIAELKEFQHDEELASAVFRSLTTSYYKLGKLLYQEEYYDESSQAFTEALKLADPITGSDIIDKLVLNYPELKIVEDDTASSMVSADDITDVSTSTNATDVMGDSFHDDITE